MNRKREVAEVTHSGYIGQTIKYHAVTFQDEWTSETAGGTCKHVMSYVRNPQYRIYLPEPSLISIYLQAEPNVYANSAFLYIFLFKWQGEDGQEEEFEIDLKGLLASNPWGRDDGVFCSVMLPQAGYYTCTLAHDQRGRRLLYQASFVAQVPLMVKRVVLESDWVVEEHLAKWETSKKAGDVAYLPQKGHQTKLASQEHEVTFHNNPQFIIRRKNTLKRPESATS